MSTNFVEFQADEKELIDVICLYFSYILFNYILIRF